MTSLADEPGITGSPVRVFLDCLAQQDFERLASTFSDDVHLRALLPAELREWEGPDRVTKSFVRWFGNTQEYELVDAGVDVIPPCVHMWWRARLRAERLGDGWFVVEQQAYADIDDAHRIQRLSLVCSGYKPEAPGR